MEIRTVDYHTAGEPFRIVTGGVEVPRGATILDKRRDAHDRLDYVRRLLVHEPRGHADMIRAYGAYEHLRSAFWEMIAAASTSHAITPTSPQVLVG